MIVTCKERAQARERAGPWTRAGLVFRVWGKPRVGLGGVARDPGPRRPPPGEPGGRALTGEGAAADTPVVVDELHAVQAALRAAGAGQALVDVPLAVRPGEAGQAAAAVPPDPVHALPAVEAAGAPGAVVDVLFAEQAWRRVERQTVRTGPLAGTAPLAGTVTTGRVAPLALRRAPAGRAGQGRARS